MTTNQTNGGQPEIKESWLIKFYDRDSVITYSWDQLRKILNQEVDPRSFQNGQVKEIVHKRTRWFGSHENGTRGFEDLESKVIPLFHAGLRQMRDNLDKHG